MALNVRHLREQNIGRTSSACPFAEPVIQARWKASDITGAVRRHVADFPPDESKADIAVLVARGSIPAGGTI
jgi:hypothetical protein